MTSFFRARCFAGLLFLSCLLLVGCAQERIRDESLLHMREGQFEKAVTGLQVGLKQYPESPILRGGLLQSRNEALARLLTEAANSRAAGRIDDAEATLQRALPFDSGGKRVNGLLAELATERRQRQALAEAEALVQAKKPQTALRVLADALKDNPRQADLTALQHRLEAEARRTQTRAAQLGLAETRPIALDFRDASLRTVLDTVTRNSGINFILDKDIRQDVRVTVLIRSAKVEDAIDLIVSTHQLAKKVVDAQTVLIYPNTPEKQREHQEQVVRVFYLASAEAKGAAAFLRSMLRLREPYVDERTNMLAIRESAENVELAERLMALYDTNEPEVLLEVEVIEIRTSRLTDLGVKFPDSVGLTPLAPAGAAGLTLGNIRGLTADRVGLGVAGLLLSLKREVGDFNTLANPRIRARNKEKAKILIGDKLPIVTTTTGQGGFVSDSVSYVDVGLKLDVEPTVYADDEVAIKISLEVSSLAREIRTSSGSLVYQIGTRTASTLLRLRDGETQLLAGLISNDERSSASRVPGLGDLPLAGRLFSAQRDESQRTELVLAITPRVLRNIRRPDASETEIWVGTEASPRVRAVGGLLATKSDAGPGAAVSPIASALGTPPASLGLSPAGAAPSPVAPPTTLTANLLAPSEVAVGDVFLATIELNSNLPLRGLPVQLRYANKQLQLLDIEEGDYFRADAAPTSFTKAVEATTGTARAGVLRNQATGAQGKGTVFKLKLKALAAGPAELSVVSLEPIPLGVPLPPVALPAALRLTIK
jgi:general secretion pathway protein D